MNLLRLPFKLTDTVLTHPLTSHKSAYRHRLYKRYFSHVNLTYQKLNNLYLNKLNKLLFNEDQEMTVVSSRLSISGEEKNLEEAADYLN